MKGIAMFDLILFGTIGFLLLILIGFLFIVIRDHMKSKSFELYVRQSQEELKKEAQRMQKLHEEAKKRVKRARSRPEQTATQPAAATERMEAETENSTPSTAEEPVREKTASSQKASEQKSEERPTIYRLHPETEPKVSEEARIDDEIVQKNYGIFTHERLVEGMGLSPEEADEFVVELIHQLENAINDLDLAIEKKDFSEIEHITHGLKGAALNIGEGGVADLLIDYNTYMKDGKEMPVIRAYQTLLKRTVSDLKVEYSQVA